MTTTHDLGALRAASVISALDEQLARTLCTIAGDDDPQVALAIALTSRQLGRGHVCLPLRALTQGQLSIELDDANDTTAAASLRWPALDAWLLALRASKLVGGTDDVTPLVLDDSDRLYLRRYFTHERTLAASVRARIAAPDLPVDTALLESGLARFFGPATEELDLQRLAARYAITRPFWMISGGPGTGKTSTVVKILALIAEQALAVNAPAPRIHLMAPTGKAAARMVESIRDRKRDLACDDAVRAAIPDEAATIHRVLSQVERRAAREASGAAPQLATDVVLVDEASMVDLALMARLFAVIPAHARVILLGDKHQLASVEAGAVLGDLCGAGLAPEASAKAPVVHLLRSHRYAANSGIGELARAIQDGDAARALDLLASERFPDVSLCEEQTRDKLGPQLQTEVLNGYAACLAERDATQVLARFEGFRVLCAHRRGQRGVESLNLAMLQLFSERALLTPVAGHFVGAPILITQNDYRNRLWNGDVGVIARRVAAAADGGEPTDTIEACFATSPGVVRRLGVTRLPAHEHAFAMSVHKSQGSEVDEVVVVLPTERSRVVTRELLYTAVTRARRKVLIYASRELVRQAVETSISRSSGLAMLLYD